MDFTETTKYYLQKTLSYKGVVGVQRISNLVISYKFNSPLNSINFNFNTDYTIKKNKSEQNINNQPLVYTTI